MESELSENYYKYLSIYQGVISAENMIDAVAQIELLVCTSFQKAKLEAKALFNLKRSDVRSSGFLNPGDSPKFIDDEESKAREIICARLSDYVSYLLSTRSPDNKVKSLYAYLIFEGLFDILSRIYVPDHLRPIVVSTITELNTRQHNILEDTEKYFSSKGITELTNFITSLGSIVLTQKKKQIEQMLRKIYAPTDEDLEFLSNKRYEFQKLTTDLDHQLIFSHLELHESSYRRSMGLIVNDLTSRLDENDIQLLTNLFLNR